MNKKEYENLMAWVLDHVISFGAMPLEFEDSSGKVWSYDEYMTEISNDVYSSLYEIIKLHEKVNNVRM